MRIARARLLLALSLILSTLTVVGAVSPVSAEEYWWTKYQIRQTYHCLDLMSETAGWSRSSVQMWSCNYGVNESWQDWDSIGIDATPNNDEDFKLINRATGKCLTYNPTVGSELTVWAESCDKNGQGWFLRYAGEDWQYESAQRWGMCLDDITTLKGSGIRLYECQSPEAAIWMDK